MSFITPNWGTRTRCLLSNWNEIDICGLEQQYAQAKCAGLPLIALEFVVFSRPVLKNPNSPLSLYREANDFLKDIPFVD